MNLTDRDKKLVLALVPLLLIAGYWFLLLAPKREEASKATAAVSTQQQRVQTAQDASATATQAETGFASDYGEIVRLGKAIPAQLDMPSLLVQLERAAGGTGIRFTKISTGDRVEGAETAPAAPAPAPGDQSAPPAAAGGEQAQSAAGSATESANDAAAGAAAGSAAASGVDPADAQTSTSSGSGLPVGGGAAPAAGGTAAPPATGALETIPLQLEFEGDFFRLADFFHDVKRFVDVAGTSVEVNGRLVTIESVKYSSDPELFPKIKAELLATVYLAPLAEGTTAGATPAGPDAVPAPDGVTPAGTESPTPPAVPTATVTP